MIILTIGILIFLATDNISSDEAFHVGMTNRDVLSNLNGI